LWENKFFPRTRRVGWNLKEEKLSVVAQAYNLSTGEAEIRRIAAKSSQEPISTNGWAQLSSLVMWESTNRRLSVRAGLGTEVRHNTKRAGSIAQVVEFLASMRPSSTPSTARKKK
jgi:hypothetical protein